MDYVCVVVGMYVDEIWCECLVVCVDDVFCELV